MDGQPNLFEIHWLRLFPWLRLFHAPAAALDLKRLAIALVGLVALAAAGSVIDRILPAQSYPPPTFDLAWFGEVPRITEPLSPLCDPFIRLFQAPVRYTDLLHNALSALAVAVIWGLCGGGIARIAALEQAKREKLTLNATARFAVIHVWTLIGTPLVPLLGVLILAVPIGLFGLLYRLGNLGTVTAGALAFVPLLGGLALALLLLGLAAGWPLMIASAAVEGEDSFDAMSRTYAYVRQRPWHYAAYAILTLTIGSLAALFVDVFARSVVHLAYWGVTLTSNDAPLRTLFGPNPSEMPIDSGHAFWLGVVVLVGRAWIYSYFWTAATTIYFLLRRDVDGTPFNVVGIDAPLTQTVPSVKDAVVPEVAAADEVATT